MDYAQVIREIENIKDYVMMLDDTVKYNITIFWTVLGIGLAAVSLGALAWIKYLVTDEVEKRLEDEVEAKLKGYVKLPDPYTPTLMMGWRGDNVQCWIDEKGYVHLDGIAYGGVMKQHMIVLPKGYRPVEELKVPLICSLDSGYCIIGTDGSVTIHAHPSAIVRFSNIIFKTS